MYYESRTYEILPASTSFSNLVKEIDQTSWHKVSSIKNTAGDIIAFVPDGHINEPQAELAIINLTKHQLIESVTWPWVKDKIAMAKEVSESTLILKTNVHLNDLNAEVFFTCGCCGNSFQSTIKEQAVHDQDAGYGICQDCI